MRIFIVISILFLSSIPAWAAQDPTPSYDAVFSQAAIMNIQLAQIAQRSDAVLQHVVNNVPGPQVYSTDTLWQDLNTLITNSSGLIKDMRTLIQNGDMKIGVLGDQLIQVISDVQANINKITSSILLLSDSLKTDIAAVVPNLNLTLSGLSERIGQSVDSVSKEIEDMIRSLSASGVQQINLIGNSLDNILVTVKDSATGVTTSITTTISGFKQDISKFVGNMDARFDQFFQLLKDSGITQIVNHVDQGIVDIMRTVNDGIRSFNEVVTAKVDGIGDKIIQIMEEVRLTMVSVRQSVEEVGTLVKGVSQGVATVQSSVVSLAKDSVDYIKGLEVDVTPRVYYGIDRPGYYDLSSTASSRYALSGGLTFILKNVVRSDNRHLLQAGFDQSDNKLTWDAQYVYRSNDWFAARAGIMHSGVGMGVSFGNLYSPRKDNFIYNADADFYSVPRGSTVDISAQFGQRNGFRAFGQLRDVSNSGAKNWRVGLGAGISF